ncbi:MAG: hypothetical protein ABIF01_04065 [Candidatus Micrarchaeota archaeon]
MLPLIGERTEYALNSHKPGGLGRDLAGDDVTLALGAELASRKISCSGELNGGKKSEGKPFSDELTGRNGNGSGTGGGHKRPNDPYSEEPPITPQSAMNSAIIASYVSSSDLDERRISHKAMDRIDSLEKRHSRDERAQSFLEQVWTLIGVGGVSISKASDDIRSGLAEAEKKMKSKIDAAAECMKSKLDHLINIKNIRKEHLEKSRLLRNVPSITTWLASIGVSAVTIYKLEQEVLDFIQNHMQKYPTIQELDHLTYCVAASLFVGAIMGAKKLINWVLGKKQEKVEREFQKDKDETIGLYQRRKTKAESEYREAHTELASEFLAKAVERAATVYASVYELCDNYYKSFIRKDENYKEYKELKSTHGEREAFDFLMRIGREEAKRQLIDYGPGNGNTFVKGVPN